MPVLIPGWMRAAIQWQTAAAAIVLAVPAVLVATFVPYRQWDAQAFGAWSRLVAETGDILPSGSAASLHRPLFYVAQGLGWRWIDDGEWVGRWLSLLFSALLVVSIWLLAPKLAERHATALMRAFAVSVALASSLLAVYVAAGMSDVPVAAMAAATAAALWWPGRPRVRVPLVALTACATVLAKPSGLVALAGVVLATIALTPRDDRRAGLSGLAALVTGTALALAYDVVKAARLDVSLTDFLRTGNSEFFVERGAAARFDAVLAGAWLGEATRLAVIAGLAFSLTRVAGARPRLGLAIAAPAAVGWSLLGPALADGDAPYPFAGPSPLGLVAWLVLAAAFLAAPFLVERDPVPRRAHAALLLWLVPGAAAWLVVRSDDLRLLSPAWPPLILLAASALTCTALALARLRPVAAVAPLAALTLLVAANVLSVDGLGRNGWRELLEIGPSGWGDRATMENFAYGQFSEELTRVRDHLGHGERVVSSDARLQYFFPGRAEVRYARSCVELREAHAGMFVLLLSDESVEGMRRAGGTSDPLAWEQCTNPALHAVGLQGGNYAAWVVGRIPAHPPRPADCHVVTFPGRLLDGVFVSGVPYDEARRVRARAASVGYAGARIELVGCGEYRVVVTGIPTPQANQDEFRQESASVGFEVEIVKGLRYLEVSPDAKPAPSSVG